MAEVCSFAFPHSRSLPPSIFLNTQVKIDCNTNIEQAGGQKHNHALYEDACADGSKSVYRPNCAQRIGSG